MDNHDFQSFLSLPKEVPQVKEENMISKHLITFFGGAYTDRI